MGLLDALFDSNSYGGQGGGLLDFIRQAQQQNSAYQPSAGFQDQAQPMAIGNYQMPRMGAAPLFAPQQEQAAIPPNAQPTQGQLPAPQTPQPPQQTQPSFLQSNSPGGFGGAFRGMAANAHTGPIGALLGGITGAMGMGQGSAQDVQRQNMRAQYDNLRQALIDNGETPQAASSKAMAVALNPEASKTIIPELFTSKTEIKMVKDAFGEDHPYSWNPRDQTFKPVGVNGEGSATSTSGGMGYLNRGVATYDPSLPGDQYLKQFSPDVQSSILAMKRGEAIPTGNARKGWAENIQKFARAYGDKIGEPINDQTYFEKKKLKTDLGASGNSTMGGILDNGESSFAHLAELGKSFSDLGSISHNFPLGGYIAQGQNALGSAFGGSDTKGKIVAAKQNLTKYGQESTKFYAGTGGGVEERTAALKTVPPESSSGEEQAAYMEKEKSLMLDRLNQKFDHIRQTLGDEEGNKVIAKKMPTINRNIATIDASIAKLRGGNSATPTPTPNALPSGWSVQVR